MTTKIITIALIVLACFVGWTVFQYWGKVSDDQKMTQNEYDAAHAAPVALDPRGLGGMPEKGRDKIEENLAAASQRGASGLRDWLKTYRPYVHDPRLAWIELDYCVQLLKMNPSEAKSVFADVKDRIAPTSPIYPRIKQLEKTFE